VRHLFARQRLGYHDKLAFEDAEFRQGICRGRCESMALAESRMLRVEMWQFESVCDDGLLFTASTLKQMIYDYIGYGLSSGSRPSERLCELSIEAVSGLQRAFHAAVILIQSLLD
jgi:hypothetical protein